MSRSPLVVAAALLAGCASSPVPAVDPAPADRAACRVLVAALPLQVDGDTDSGRSEYAAAWGDPRMVLKCGVPVPAAYQKTSEMIVIDGVSWFGEERADGFSFTAVGRSPLVEVYVPDTHRPEVNPLVDLADVMKEKTEVTGAAGVAP